MNTYTEELINFQANIINSNCKIPSDFKTPPFVYNTEGLLDRIVLKLGNAEIEIFKNKNDIIIGLRSGHFFTFEDDPTKIAVKRKYI